MWSIKPKVKFATLSKIKPIVSSKFYLVFVAEQVIWLQTLKAGFLGAMLIMGQQKLNGTVLFSTQNLCLNMYSRVRPDFFLGKFRSDLRSGDKTRKKALKMTSRLDDQLIGHFQSFFFNISRKNNKASKVNQQSVLNLFHHFPKNLDRTITLKNTLTEFFFNKTNNI